MITDDSPFQAEAVVSNRHVRNKLHHDFVLSGANFRRQSRAAETAQSSVRLSDLDKIVSADDPRSTWTGRVAFNIEMGESQIDSISKWSRNNPSAIPAVRIRIGEIRTFDDSARTPQFRVTHFS